MVTLVGVLCRPFKSAVLFNIQGKEGEINELVKREKGEKGEVVQISADDVTARSLKRLQKWNVAIRVGAFSSTTFKSPKMTPNFTKWQRQSQASRFSKQG